MPDLKPICLVNRTPDVLQFTADGQSHRLTPGDNWGFFAWQAPYAKAQNPLMGSEDYYSLNFTSLVGVKGEDDCTPIPEEDLLAAMDQVERFDRVRDGLRPANRVPNRFSITRGRGPSSGAGQDAMAIGRG